MVGRFSSSLFYRIRKGRKVRLKRILAMMLTFVMIFGTFSPVLSYAEKPPGSETIEGTIESPEALEQDTSYEINPFNPEAEKYFTFHISETGEYRLDILSQRNISLSCDFGLLEGAEFIELTTESEWDSSYIYNFTDTGIYCLKLVNTNSSGDAGSVVFALSKVINTLSEPGVLTLGTSLEAAAFAPKSTQFFAFSIPEEGSYVTTYSVVYGSPKLTMDIGTVTDDEFSSIRTDDKGIIEYTFDVTGDYLLRVANTGTYGEADILIEEKEVLDAPEKLITPLELEGTAGLMSASVSGTISEPGAITVGETYGSKG